MDNNVDDACVVFWLDYPDLLLLLLSHKLFKFFVELLQTLLLDVDLIQVWDFSEVGRQEVQQVNLLELIIRVMDLGLLLH